MEVEVYEPALELVASSVTHLSGTEDVVSNGDAGDLVRFNLSLSHAAQSNMAAYAVSFADTLSHYLRFRGESLSLWSTPAMMV